MNNTEIEEEKLTRLAELFRKGARCIDHIVELLGSDDKEAMENAWDQYILCMMKISEFSKD